MNQAHFANEQLVRLERREVRHLARYNPGLAVESVRGRFKLKRIAKLASNENPLGASPRAIAALTDIGKLAASYPDAECAQLKAALGRFLGIPSERLIIGNGSENLVELACLAYLNHGERVVMQDPGFGLHEIYARLMSATVEKISFDGEFHFDVAAWQRALAEPAKMVIMTNPSNPVGCRMDCEQFRSVVESAARDILLLVDEAYYEFAKGPGYPDTLAELAQQPRPWLVLRTFSKAYGLAGLRVGYGVASSPELVDALDRVRTPFNVNAVAQAAAAAALEDQDHVLRSVETIRCERERVRRELENCGYMVAPSHTNFLFFDSREPAGALAERLLARGVIVKAWREPGYEQFVRVTIGSRADNELFLSALRDVARR